MNETSPKLGLCASVIALMDVVVSSFTLNIATDVSGYAQNTPVIPTKNPIGRRSSQ